MATVSVVALAVVRRSSSTSARSVDVVDCAAATASCSAVHSSTASTHAVLDSPSPPLPSPFFAPRFRFMDHRHITAGEAEEEQHGHRLSAAPAMAGRGPGRDRRPWRRPVAMGSGVRGQ
ncbi:hypothetical protein GQ55_5G218600 [Panicum hallii var. hallii]|uniref:Uncharacterized protein n=1 Tax=Panicum hallii var. hallii TaxID=1504633 RepID=A0A2T7DIW5_9POAL|nr:hypothetical protein GQ55_5G218600 [Panicum hallii var. hallii]